MNDIYLCKVSDFQVSGNQIDIQKKIATDFFRVPESVIRAHGNFEMNVCHFSSLTEFQTIEIQTATNVRWSTKLNTFLAEKGDPLTKGCLLLFERLERTFCVRTIKKGDAKYEALIDLFETEESHMLLSASLGNQPTNTDKIASNYRPYITAIKSKPFLLLAGISGTGKSRIVRELARACWDADSEEFKAQKPRNFEMVQVKPNWHDSTELIGYVSRVSGTPVFVAGEFLMFIVKAWEELDVPYFLCLDEMNLAPVEQYFAEYLSVIESRKADVNGNITTDPILKKSKEDWYRVLTRELTDDDDLRNRFLENGICIPQNLIVVGTVNMDETTFSFSRKVLDRAMTIEMNEVDLSGGLDTKYEQIGKLTAAELIGNAVEGVDIYSSYKNVCDTAIDYLQKVNDQLEGTPFKIAYRTRNEALLYVVNNLPYNKDEDLDEGQVLKEGYIIARALDEITNMKILSRIEGDETKVNAKFFDDLGLVIKTELEEISECSFDKEETDEAFKSISLAKLNEMKERLKSGYTSFWS